MIDQAITFLTDQLDQHLQSAFVFSGPALTLATPGKSPAGTAPPEGLVLSLLQVSRDPMAPHGGTQPEVQGTQVIQRKPPLSLTLHLLLCANYDERYDQGLSVLTSAISYFHSNALFAEDTAPTLPAGMGKL
ncbi:MAG: Pvc16 family protein, partial [Pseudomonadota bacterium]